MPIPRGSELLFGHMRVRRELISDTAVNVELTRAIDQSKHRKVLAADIQNIHSQGEPHMAVAAALLASGAAARERQREEAEKAEFQSHIRLTPTPYTQVPRKPHGLTGLKEHQEHLQVKLKHARSGATLLKQTQKLRTKVVSDIANVRGAYNRGDLYATLSAAALLKRHVHHWRVVAEALNPKTPLPTRGSQWRGLVPFQAGFDRLAGRGTLFEQWQVFTGNQELDATCAPRLS